MDAKPDSSHQSSDRRGWERQLRRSGRCSHGHGGGRLRCGNLPLGPCRGWNGIEGPESIADTRLRVYD